MGSDPLPLPRESDKANTEPARILGVVLAPSPHTGAWLIIGHKPSGTERIEEFDAGPLDIGDIAGGESQADDLRCRGQETVDDG